MTRNMPTFDLIWLIIRTNGLIISLQLTGEWHWTAIESACLCPSTFCSLGVLQRQMWHRVDGSDGNVFATWWTCLLTQNLALVCSPWILCFNCHWSTVDESNLLFLPFHQQVGTILYNFCFVQFSFSFFHPVSNCWKSKYDLWL